MDDDDVGGDGDDFDDYDPELNGDIDEDHLGGEDLDTPEKEDDGLESAADEVAAEPADDGEESDTDAVDEGDEAETGVGTEEHDEGVIYIKTARPSNPKGDSLLKISNSHRKVIIVPDDERITSNILQKPEAVHVISMRAKQIETFPTSFVDSTGIHDSVERAKKELMSRACPLRLRREVGRGPSGESICEEWIIREMTISPLD